MAGFVYFIEGAQNEKEARDILAANGAEYVLEGAPSFRGPTPGPETRQGTLVVPEAGPGGTQIDIFLHADIDWAEASGYWIGLDPAAPPCPLDLARSRPFRGHKIELPDGNLWHMPVARSLAGESGFPRTLTRAAGSWAVGDVVAAYADLWESACRLWNELIDNGDQSGAADSERLTVADTADIICRALALNYRLGADEIAILDLFNTDSLLRAAEALVDFPSVATLKKKLQATASTSEHGNGD